MSGFIQSIFAKSPLKSIRKHIKKVNECSLELIPFFEAVFLDDWDKASEIQHKIKQLEKEADDLKKLVRMRLPTGLFLPVSRNDLLDLATKQDEISNSVKDIAGIILGRHLHIPSDLKEVFMNYIQKSVESVKIATNVIGELDNLLETGFKGKEVKTIENMVEELALIENETDSIQIEIRHSLYKRENELNPIDAIFIYQILNTIGNLSDLAESVGAKLEIMVGRV